MNLNVILTAGLFASLAGISFADTAVKVVDNYRLASDRKIWKGASTDSIPHPLLKDVIVETPVFSYSKLFPKSFYQTENYVVCFKSCSNSDSKSSKDSLEQQNVYYWLDNFFKITNNRFHLHPASRMRVITSREVMSPGSTKQMQNNAFFNSSDGTLSFLQAHVNPLAVLFNGKINRAGFDPSVIIHEAGHSLFNSLFPNAINQEIQGLNEGFADYLANIILNEPKIGLVMLRGTALRDSSSFIDIEKKPKIYSPGLEVHELGERFSAAFWLGRQKINNVDEYDDLLINTIKELSLDPYATVHGFKEKFISRIKYVYDSKTYLSISAIWNFFFPGDNFKISDTDFLKENIYSVSIIGMNNSITFPTSVLEEFGNQNINNRFVYLKSTITKDGYKAFLIASRDESYVVPYWIVIDPERWNTLGAWKINGSKVKDPQEIKKVRSLALELRSLSKNLNEFVKSVQQISDLATEKGTLSYSYNVLFRSTQEKQYEFNGEIFDSKILKLNLSRKFGARVKGVENYKSVSLITAGDLFVTKEWPLHNNEPVIGIRFEFEDGSMTEQKFETIYFY